MERYDMVGWVFPSLHSNLRMYEGNLVDMGGQVRSWAMGSFINLLKFGEVMGGEGP